MANILSAPPCSVCGEPSKARGMCKKHWSKWYKSQPIRRKVDGWGQRSKHPLRQSWCSTRRVSAGRVKEWDDFWVFVKDVGERPSPDHVLKRVDDTQPFGPENCFWREPLGISVSCREQSAEYQKQWRIRNPRSAKNSELKKQYGIGLAEYEAMLEAQGHKCAICGGSDEWFRLAVDHCHDTKGVRGLLCSQCNRGIGLFRDNPEALESAANYLRRVQCTIPVKPPT